MKISLMSDLHLDISGFLDLPGGDVLILAGDICEADSFQKEFRETKLLDRKIGEYPCYDFFNHVATKYTKVFYVMGNHEHYHGRFDLTKETLKSMLPSNVTILDNSVAEYNGIMFMGSTLWTDCNKNDPITIWELKNNMNDYRVIKNFYPNQNSYYKLIPEFTIAQHKKTLEYFCSQLSANQDKPFIIITHHAPSFASVSGQYKSDWYMNGGYASELSDMILKFPNIKCWTHGHMHNPVDYQVGGTRILSNPRGYLPWEDDHGFDPCFTFEL